jgi:hypothetical protein
MAKIVRAYCLTFIGAFSCVHGNDALAATQTGRRCHDPLPVPERNQLAAHHTIAESEPKGRLAGSVLRVPCRERDANASARFRDTQVGFDVL